MKYKRKRTRNKKKRGGTRYFYPYNSNPITFTNTSNRQQGGFLGMGDPRYSLLPVPLNDSLNQVQYSLTSSSNATSGNYQDVNPNWRIQPRLN